MIHRRLLCALCCTFVLGACSADTGALGRDAGDADTGRPIDTGLADTGTADAGMTDLGVDDGGGPFDVPDPQPDAGPPPCSEGQVTNCFCADGSPGAAVCDARGEYGPCQCSPQVCPPDDLFCQIEVGMVGVWEGFAFTRNSDVYQVRIEFRANGRYVADCLDSACNVPFYYGTTDSLPSQTYELIDLQANEEGKAEIAIVFGPNQRPNIGELQRIRLNDDNSSLEFRFAPTWGSASFYVDYELYRLQ